MKKILIAILGLSLFAATALADEAGSHKDKNKAKPAKPHKGKSKKGSGATTTPPPK